MLDKLAKYQVSCRDAVVLDFTKVKWIYKPSSYEVTIKSDSVTTKPEIDF